jgi:hypothetical protein
VLYYYQFDALRRGVITSKDVRTVFEIDNIREYRDFLRSLSKKELIIAFYEKVS